MKNNFDPSTVIFSGKESLPTFKRMVLDLTIEIVYNEYMERGFDKQVTKKIAELYGAVYGVSRIGLTRLNRFVSELGFVKERFDKESLASATEDTRYEFAHITEGEYDAEIANARAEGALKAATNILETHMFAASNLKKPLFGKKTITTDVVTAALEFSVAQYKEAAEKAEKNLIVAVEDKQLIDLEEFSAGMPHNDEAPKKRRGRKPGTKKVVAKKKK